MAYKEVEPIIKKLDDEMKSESKAWSDYDKSMIDIGLRVAIGIIKEQPTADVVEVKQGEWIKPQFVAHRGFYEVKEFKCSVCNKTYEVKQPCNFMNYCPYCGTKMSVNYKSSKNER